MNENMQVNINPNSDTVKILYQEPTEYIYKGSQCELTSTQAIIDLINKPTCHTALRFLIYLPFLSNWTFFE